MRCLWPSFSSLQKVHIWKHWVDNVYPCLPWVGRDGLRPISVLLYMWHDHANWPSRFKLHTCYTSYSLSGLNFLFFQFCFWLNANVETHDGYSATFCLEFLGETSFSWSFLGRWKWHFWGKFLVALLTWNLTRFSVRQPPVWLNLNILLTLIPSWH